MLGALVSKASRERLKLLEMCFDPNGLRPYIENWEQAALHFLQRVAREHLQTGREALARLLSRILAFPDVPQNARSLDLSTQLKPVFEVRFRHLGQRFAFLTTLTSFSAPQDVTLDELRIESYFPLDDATTRLCELLATKK